MKRIHQLLLLVAIGASMGGAALAQQAKPAQTGKSPAAASAEMTEGEVRKVDKSAGKITLKHGEIKRLDMPAMTMVFGVAERAMLDKLKQGDKVRFRAANADGKLTVTEIQKARSH